MTRMNTKLPAAVETYLADLRRVSASGGVTGERSSYGPLANPLKQDGEAVCITIGASELLVIWADSRL